MRNTTRDLGIKFLCDRRACDICDYPFCKHTWDIAHAVSFHKDQFGNFCEYANDILEEEEDDE